MHHKQTHSSLELTGCTEEANVVVVQPEWGNVDKTPTGGKQWFSILHWILYTKKRWMGQFTYNCEIVNKSSVFRTATTLVTLGSLPIYVGGTIYRFNLMRLVCVLHTHTHRSSQNNIWSYRLDMPLIWCREWDLNPKCNSLTSTLISYAGATQGRSREAQY